jgi:hypothetical protein
MPFGKHRGERLADIPASYLHWVVENCKDLDGWLATAIRRELDVRQARRHQGDAGTRQARPTYPPPAELGDLISQWHRRLVLRHHPDRGGDVKVMQALNAAVDELRQLVGGS